VVVKSQVLAGGRGLGTFKNGFKGGVHIVKIEDAEGVAKKMLGETLVTKQTGEGGKPVNTLYIASKLDLVNEMYFAILLDRATAGPMLIGCSEGHPPPFCLQSCLFTRDTYKRDFGVSGTLSFAFSNLSPYESR
jgi:succinyl-CoA synthetase beta subunit